MHARSSMDVHELLMTSARAAAGEAHRFELRAPEGILMDPLRIAVRTVFVFLTLLALVRCSGKRTVRQGTPFDFTVALILGDMADDAAFAEVALSQFVIAAGTLLIAHVLTDIARFRVGAARS